MDNFKVVVNPVSYSATIVIDDVIEHPKQLSEAIDALGQLSEFDNVLIQLNTVGGRDDATQALIVAMNNCPAHIHGEIVHDCCSNGTVIFLNCDSHSVADNCKFMIHTLSHGYSGKECDTMAYANFTHKYNKNLVETTYKDFLTEDEIADVLRGGDIWLHKDEVEERLARKFPQNYQEPLTEEDLSEMSKENLIKLLTGQPLEDEQEPDVELESDDEPQGVLNIKDGDIETLKQLADKHSIKYSHNIGFKKLYERVVDKLEKDSDDYLWGL